MTTWKERSLCDDDTEWACTERVDIVESTSFSKYSYRDAIKSLGSLNPKLPKAWGAELRHSKHPDSHQGKTAK